ncbi:unnamed protein product [Urochloa decumbens]|uniref:KIB1-4 beta-propeller domain-containing protein n=1 Tax=Urochloa decumbens TaxID=240449 RepID=A0ABC9G2V5_9POAL
MAASPLATPLSPDMSSPCWASCLPGDLVRLLASRLLAADFADYVRFRAVCGPWRSSTASPRGRGVLDPRFHPRRWMMFPEGNGLHPGHPNLHGYVRFFNLDTGAFVRVHIGPLLEHHSVLDSLDGLLVLHRDHDTAIRLLHPFTGDLLDLPPLSTLLPQMHQDLHHLPAQEKLLYLRSLSTAATFADGVVTVMLALSKIYRVAVATSQDHGWSMSTWYYRISRPPFSCQGKTYVVYSQMGADRTAKIFQIDTPLPGEVLQTPKLIATSSLVKLYAPVYFVECNSEILVIGHSDIRVSKMLVYKLTDLVMERNIPVTSIGDKAIFLQSRTLAASAKALPTLVGDTIIYIHPMKQYISQYDLTTGSWSLAMDQCSLRGTEPGPCSLVQHIFTCCSPTRHWTKGLLYHSMVDENTYGRWPPVTRT